MDSTPEQPIEPYDSQRPEAVRGKPEPMPAPQRSTLRCVFIGPYGLRAGWSLFIYILTCHRSHPSTQK